MKIHSIRLENFRSFKDETINLDDYTAFVGQNGAGKSTILTALNIFFREKAEFDLNPDSLEKEDFHHRRVEEPIRITVTFEDLSPEAQEDFQDYFRNNQLIVTAIAQWDEASTSAKVVQKGNRMGIEAFRRYFDADKDGEKADVLKTIFADLRQEFPDLPTATTKPSMAGALQQFESNNQDLCTLIPSEDQFYGVSRGANKLEKYVQWVYVPAVKEAGEEKIEAKSSAFGKLLARRVHSQLNLNEPIGAIKQEALVQYRQVLTENQAELDQLSESLSSRFQQWSHQDAGIKLGWNDEEDSIVDIKSPIARLKAYEGIFDGDLSRFGHGLQRSFIFALLQELAQCDDPNGPTLILGVEEPELYQHPPQARYLASVLQKLSTENSQIILCTHSPFFVSGKDFQNIRMVHKAPKDEFTSVRQATYDAVAARIAEVKEEQPTPAGGLMAKVHQEMQSQMNEMFFASFRVFVEGVEDVAYLNTYLTLTEHMDEFRSRGGHIIQTQGKEHLVQAIAISAELGLPHYVVFDADGDESNDGRRKHHENDNSAILELLGSGKTDNFPSETTWLDQGVMWPTRIGDIAKEEIGSEHWTEVENDVRAEHKNFISDMKKNALFLGYFLTEAWNRDYKSPTLERLCEEIMNRINTDSEDGEA